MTANEPQSIEQVQDELIEEFGFFDDWMDRYQYIIDLGKQLPEFPESYQTDENKVRGCQSQVWLHAERRDDGTLHFEATSDSAIVSGLIAILLRVYSDRTAREILAAEPRFVEGLGLSEHLSPTRHNGLHAMLKRIEAEAAAAAAA